MTIIVYSKPNCPQCETLKAQLNQAGIKYEVFDVSRDEAARDWLLRQGHRSVPQMYQQFKASFLHIQSISELQL